VESYQQRILIIDADSTFYTGLSFHLNKLGYQTYNAPNGQEALRLFQLEKPHIILLDILIPKIDGYEICSRIRQESKAPIIMLAPFKNITDCVRGLELGADDYLTKPFSLKELKARLSALLRRTKPSEALLKKTKSSILQIGNLLVNRSKQEIYKNGKIIKFTNIEFNILEMLIENIEKPLTRTRILDNVWGYTPERDVDTRIVDVHIHKLRSKLEENPQNPDFIKTVRGIGYKFRIYNPSL
jgi:OmpR family response regulator RpaB